MSNSSDAKKRWAERERCRGLGKEPPAWARLMRGGIEVPQHLLVGRQSGAGRRVRRGVKENGWDDASAIVRQGDARDLIRDVEMTAYVISDPPYNQGYHYDEADDSKEEAEYKALLQKVFQGRRAVVMHYPEEMINLVAPSVGRVRDVMAWVYPSNQPKQHRLVAWFGCRPDWRRTPQDYKNPDDRRVARLIAEGKRARGYDWIEANHVKNVENAGHPCPIPYEVAERLVLATTMPGDLVVDPFCGTGTVLDAALRNERRALGFELSSRYCEIARRNVERALRGEPRLAGLPKSEPEKKQHSLFS